MDTLKTLKKVSHGNKVIKILGVESERMGWAEALTDHGMVRSFGKNVDEAVNKVLNKVNHDLI